MISGLLTFRKWLEISSWNPKRSGHGIFQKFLLFLNSTYPTLFLFLLYSDLSLFYFYLNLFYIYFIFLTTLPYSTLLPSSLGIGSHGRREVGSFRARGASWSLLGYKPGYPWCKGSGFRALVRRLDANGNFRVALCIRADAHGCW